MTIPGMYPLQGSRLVSAEDPTYGRIPHAIQWYVDAMNPSDIGQRVALEQSILDRFGPDFTGEPTMAAPTPTDRDIIEAEIASSRWLERIREKREHGVPRDHGLSQLLDRIDEVREGMSRLDADEAAGVLILPDLGDYLTDLEGAAADLANESARMSGYAERVREGIRDHADALAPRATAVAPAYASQGVSTRA